MKILIDENIPYATELFSRLGEVKTFSGRSIPINELNNTDILIVRSVTKINKNLLADKKIHFVGTATSGIDHIDYEWLIRAGIGFSSAPGCNTISVVEYVLSSLLMLGERDDFLLKNRTIGIVGVGKIGGLLKKNLEVLKVPTLLCDPPRADNGDEENFYSINELVAKCDVLTLHTPLLIDGPYRSMHMINETLIRRLKPGAILINTCRGPVVDNAALLKCLETGQELSVVLDVWEYEPNINIELLKKVDIATAHIAGYTLEGKVRGTTQIFESCSRFLGKNQQVALNKLLPTPEFSSINMHGSLDQSKLKKLAHLIYNVQQDDYLLRRAAGTRGGFDNLRKNYFKRREWSSLFVMCDDINTTEILNNLGFKAMYQTY